MASSAHLVLLYQLQLAFKQMFNNRSHCFTFRAVIDFDSRLVKAHERPHPDSPNYQSIRAALLQEIYRGLASALLVRRIVYHRNIADFSVFDLYQSKDVTMPEVS